MHTLRTRYGRCARCTLTTPPRHCAQGAPSPHTEQARFRAFPGEPPTRPPVGRLSQSRGASIRWYGEGPENATDGDERLARLCNPSRRRTGFTPILEPGSGPSEGVKSRAWRRRTGRQIHRLTHRLTHRPTHRLTHRLTYRRTGRRTGRQTGRQTGGAHPARQMKPGPPPPGPPPGCPVTH